MPRIKSSHAKRDYRRAHHTCWSGLGIGLALQARLPHMLLRILYLLHVLHRCTRCTRSTLTLPLPLTLALTPNPTTG